MRVLVTEDDPALAAFLRKCLELEGHQVQVAADGDACVEQVRSETFDLVLLDLNLPALDGTAVLQHLQALAEIPAVIVVTGRTAISERIRCLDMGVDDLILKPFSMAELTARCRAALRRRGRTANPDLRVGDLSLSRLERTVRYAGVPLELTPREFALLEMLMLRGGGCCSREELLEQVWRTSTEGSANVLDVYINYLRRKLAVAAGQGAAKSLIETVRGKGYRLAIPPAAPVAPAAQQLPAWMVLQLQGA